jgi:tetratricopeptide (TPR) repeat protein
MGAGVLVLAALLAYAPALGGAFLWDDSYYVGNNPHLRSLDGLRIIWLDVPPRNLAYPLLQYYPLTFTSFWVDQHLWPAQSTVGHHVHNLLLHVLSGLLLWGILARLGVRGAWLAAAVFTLHPVHVESVAWITERKNVLSGVFYLAAVGTYLGFEDAATARARRSFYLGSLLFFACALLSKTVTASMPLAVLLISWWKRGRLGPRDLVPLLPFLALGIAAGRLTAWMEVRWVGATGPDWGFSLLERCLIAGRALWFYAAKLLWPHPLMFIYPRWTIDPSAWWQYLFPAAAIAVVTVAWLARRRIGRGPLAAILFFAGSLVPALGFFNVYPMRFSFVADHFQYLASIGLVTMAAALLARLGRASARAAPWRALVGPVGAGVLLAALGLLTWQRAHAFADPAALWLDTIQKNPAAWVAHHNYALTLERAAMQDPSAASREQALSTATAHLEQALALKPNFAIAAMALGAVLQDRGKLDEAARVYRAALSLEPDHPSDALGPEHQALMRFQLASILARQGDMAAARELYEEGLRVRPHDGAYMSLGFLLAAEGRLADAMQQYEAALRVNPASVPAHLGLARTLLLQGNLDAAVAHWTAAARLAPDDPSIPNDLGLAYARFGRYEDAIAQFEAALRRNPDFAIARRNLEMAKAAQRGAPAAP